MYFIDGLFSVPGKTAEAIIQNDPRFFNCFPAIHGKTGVQMVYWAGREEETAMWKAYIWDLDGTLLDSYGSIVSSLVSVARGCGAEDGREGILKTVKQGSVSGYLRNLAERTGRDYAELYQTYREVSHGRLEEIGLIPGAAETLEALRKAGVRHFVYTHRGKSAVPLLERLGLADFFEETVTYEYGFAPKPSGDGVRYLLEKYALEKTETAYVGDRTLDAECALDAGVRAVLYLPEGTCAAPTGREDLVIRSLEELAPEGGREDGTVRA